MERIIKVGSVFGLFCFSFGLCGVLISQNALANLLTSDSLTESNDDFPSSRFGSSPAVPDMGFGIPQLYVEDSTSLTPPSKLKPPAPPSRGIASATSESELSNPSVIPKSLQGEQELALIVSDTGFYPHTLFVTRNLPVRLYVTSSSKNSLCFMVDEFKIQKQVHAQVIEEIQFTPTRSGSFRLYCPINGIEGTIYVKEYTRLTGD